MFENLYLHAFLRSLKSRPCYGLISISGSGNTIDAYASAAKNVQKSTAPSSESGGKLIDESDISSAASSAAGSTATAGRYVPMP